MVNYSCPLAKDAVCPVSLAHQQHFLSSPYSLPPRSTENNSFCSWARNFLSEDPPEPKEPLVVNVVVLGGSVAMGYGTFGCCCSSCDGGSVCLDDYSLSRSIAAPHLTVRSDWELVPTSYGCAWSGRIVRWLNRFSFQRKGRKVQFVLRNLGEGSANSQHTSRVLAKQLGRANLTLRSTDIVFLDHSHNDIGFQGKLSEGPTSGLELLVRKVLMLAQPGMPPPAIVLLQSYPFLYPQQNVAMYDRLAGHYGLLHWNMRPVVEGLAKEGSSEERPWDAYLRLKHLCFTDIHPSWHLHLFLADLVAHALSSAFSLCSSAPAPASASASAPASAVKSATLSPALPAPLNALPRDAQCSSSRPPLLDLDATDLAHGQGGRGGGGGGGGGGKIGQVTSTGAWVFQEERHKKFGWIIDSNSSSSSSSSSSLVFTTQPPGVTPLSLSTEGLIIRVFYLATYFNAGKADVYFCGIKLGTIDALWDAYRTYHVSAPDLFVAELGAGSEALRDKVCVEKDSDRASLEIRHTPVDLSSVPDREERAARGRQKIRIIGVSVCLRAVKP